MSTLKQKIREAWMYISAFLQAKSEYTVELMRANPYRIQEMIKPTKEIQRAAIQTDPSVIKLIENPSEKMKLLAISTNPSSIKYIQEPSEKLQLTAIKIDPDAIQYINNPSEKIQLLAIDLSPLSIRHIPEPSENLQLAVVRSNPANIKHIKHPTISVQLEVIHTATDGNLINSVQMNVVKANPNAISLFQISSEAIQLEAVKQDPFVISKISNPSEKVQLAAVKLNPFVISKINNPHESAQILALEIVPERIKLNGESIIKTGQSSKIMMSIDNPSERLQLAAIKKNALNIDCIINPSEAIQLAAIQQKSSSYLSITNPTEKVQCEAFKKEPSYFQNTTNPTALSSQTAVENLLDIKISTPVKDDFIEKTQNLFAQLNNIEHHYNDLSLTADYADDRQQASREQDAADKWKDIETNKVITNFKEDIKSSYPFTENNIQVQSSFPISSTKELHSSGSKTLLADVSPDTGTKTGSYLIHDKSTNKTGVLSVGDIDLSKQPAESLQGLLSGKQVEMTNTSGFKQMMGLNKTPAGWGLQVGKQVFSAADTSAEI